MIETKDIFTISAPTSSGRPFLNESQMGALSLSSTFLADKRTLMNWIKRTAEAIGMLRQISNDVVTRINFVSMDKKATKGRPKKDSGDSEAKALEFSKKVFLKQVLRAAIIEELALGDGYIWKGKVDPDQLKEIIGKHYKNAGIELKETEIEKKALDENFVGEKPLQYVAAATMQIELDESGTKIKSYIQSPALGFGNTTFPSSRITNRPSDNASSPTTFKKTRKWKPEQIIHKKFIDIDGKVHGFTPMQSCFPIIKTLGAIKDYHGHYFESGVVADTIFNFEEMDANSAEFETMRQVIDEWSNNKRRSHMVTASKFDVKEINKWNKDMEFRMLAIYYTGVIAFSMGMPLEKIRAILGGEIKSSTGASDISNSDYLRNTMDMQDDWENLMNTQFFNEEFGVNMRFTRPSTRDQQVEAMRDELKLNIIDKLTQMDLIKEDKKIELYEAEFPDIPKDWWNPNPKPEMGMGMLPSSKVLPPPGKEALSNKKKDEQKPQAMNKPPTGS